MAMAPVGNSNPGRWNLAEVLDAIDAVGRFYGLAGWRFDEWRDAAWAVFLRRAELLRLRFRGAAARRRRAPTCAPSSPMSASHG